MASTYSTNLGLELIATGEQSGTWGATTNTNFGTLTEQAIVGYGTQIVTDSGTATVLTISNGASSTGRNYVIALTGTLTADRTVTVPAVNKPYVFFNNTVGGFSVTVKVSGQTGVTIANGKKAIVYTNSTDVIEVANAPVTEAGTQTLTNKTLTTPVINGFSGSTAAITIGTSQFVKDTSGNVGIGTASPAEAFNVKRGAGVSAYAEFAGNNNTLGTTSVLYGQDSGSNGYFYNRANAPIIFGTNSTERMRINATGNVGIGTTSPAYPLDVNGLIGSKGGALATRSSAASSGFVYNNFYDAAGNAAILCGAYSDTANAYRNAYHIFGSVGGATEYMRIDTSGNLLVGTNSSDARLNVLASDSLSSNYAILARNSSSTTLFYVRNDGYLTTGTASFSPYNYTTGNAANVFIDTNGGLVRSTSSLRYKNSIQDATYGLDDVLKLRAVTYKNNNDGDHVFGGFIAEEVDSAGLKEFVSYDKEGRPDALHYANMAALMARAIQELAAKVAALEGK